MQGQLIWPSVTAMQLFFIGYPERTVWRQNTATCIFIHDTQIIVRLIDISVARVVIKCQYYVIRATQIGIGAAVLVLMPDAGC